MQQPSSLQQPFTRPLSDIFRSTLWHLEKAPDLDRDDPAYREIRGSIVEAVIRLEFCRSKVA